jgi:predicted NodU family carbamoyl transferase
MTDILGISAFYHDSAACLVRDGTIVAAAQEERFTRKKQDASFPGHAVQYCLQAGGIPLHSVQYVVFYDNRWSSLSVCWRPISPLHRVGCAPLLPPCPSG